MQKNKQQHKVKNNNKLTEQQRDHKFKAGVIKILKHNKLVSPEELEILTILST